MILAWWSFGLGGSWCRLLWASMFAGRAVLTVHGLRRCWLANRGGALQGGVHGPASHNVFANEGPSAVYIERENDPDLPRLGGFVVAALDFADDRVLPAYSHAAAQTSIERAAKQYERNCLVPNTKKSVVLIYDPTGNISYNNGDKFYTRADAPGRFILEMAGEPLTFVDTFKYLGIHFNKRADFQATADAVFTSSEGKMWAVLAKIRSLFTLPFLFALMLYKALVRGAQSYGSELWLPLVETRAADRTLVTFMPQLFFCTRKPVTTMRSS
jgi:hypothetical protein